MARVVVGKCTKCGKELHVKEGGVRPKMKLTCKCGQTNEIGQDLGNLTPLERVEIILNCLQGEDNRISSNLCAAELERIVKRAQPDEIDCLLSRRDVLSKLAAQQNVPGQRTIIWCLGQLGHVDGAATLLDLVKSEAYAPTREAAIRALGNIFYQSYIHPFLTKAVDQGLKIVRLPPGFGGYTLPGKNKYKAYETATEIVCTEFTGGDERIIEAIGFVATQDGRSRFMSFAAS